MKRRRREVRSSTVEVDGRSEVVDASADCSLRLGYIRSKDQE